MLEQRLDLVFKYFVKLLCLGVFKIKLRKLLDTTYEECKLFEDLLQNLHILIVNWLMEQVVETEATGDHKHQALVKLRRDFEQSFIIVLQL
jgi:hypothetical protein